MKSLACLCSFFLFVTFLHCENITWEFPPTNLPGAASGNITPSIAYNQNKIGVAVWENSFGGDVLQSAKCTDGTWVALPVIPNTPDLDRPLVGIDDAGQAICLWADANPVVTTLHFARLNGTTWTVIPLPLSFFIPPPSPHQLAVSRGGNAAAVMGDGGSTTVIIYDKGIDSISPTGPFIGKAGGEPYSISMNASGRAMAAYVNFIGEVVGLYYNGTTWAASPIDMPAVGQTKADVMINDNNEALAVWVEAGTIHSAFFNGTTWSPIAGSFATTADDPKVGFFNDGTGIAVWLDTGALAIRGARYNGTSWTVFASPISTALVVDNPTLAPNWQGRAVAAWPASADGTVTAAAYDANVWNPPTTLSMFAAETIVGSMNIFGDALIGWTTLSTLLVEGPGYNAIRGSFPTSPPSEVIQPPSNLCVCVTPSKFLTQTTFRFCLSWNASPSSDVKCYRIFRNGKAIAEVPATTLCYTDCFGCEHTLYQVAAVDSEGRESTKISPAC